MPTAGRNALIVALGSLTLFTACGNKEAEGAPAQGSKAAAASKPASGAKPASPPKAVEPDMATANVPPEWLAQRRSGRLGMSYADNQGLMVISAWLYQHPERLANYSNFITALYSCEEAKRAKANEIERPAIYARARERLQTFFGSMPKTVTVRGLYKLGDWQPDLGAFAWDIGGNRRDAVAAPNIMISSNALSATCMPSDTYSLFGAPIMLRLQNGKIPPLKMPQAAASQLADRLKGDRYVIIEWEVSLDDPNGKQHAGERAGQFVDLYPQRAIVRDQHGGEIARF